MNYTRILLLDLSKLFSPNPDMDPELGSRLQFLNSISDLDFRAAHGKEKKLAMPSDVLKVLRSTQTV